MLADSDPASTLFVVASKTFGTIETLTNARTARAWLVDALGEGAVADHFVAVSTNAERVAAFGIDTANMFGFWDWVGGRYSVDSAIGLSLMIAIGPERVPRVPRRLPHDRRALPHGAARPRTRRCCWRCSASGTPTCSGYDTKAVLPYAQRARPVPGVPPAARHGVERQVGRASTARPVDGDTGPIVWGEPGTNGQHAFYQLLHQGTRVVPADFIGFATPNHPYREHHDLLMANLFAQSEALAFGRAQRGRTAPQLPGNRPTTVILADRLTPSVLGQLIALYEHIVTSRGRSGASTASTSGASNSARSSPTRSPPS